MLSVSIENLECFDAAARTLNFRAAARAVALSPAAFGQRIQQLEEGVGERLFERTTRSVRLTRAGTVFLPKARRCLEAARDCADFGKGAPRERVELTLGTRFELGMSWLVPELPAIERSIPELALHLYFGASPDLVARLRARQLDCVVTSARLSDAALDAETLHEERYVFVGSRKLLARFPFTRWPHAERHCLLDIDASLPLFRYLADAHGARARYQFGRSRWLGIGAAIKAMLLAGEGVAVMPLYMVARELRDRRLVRIFPSAPIEHDHFRLVFRRDEARRDLYRSLSRLLRATPIR